MSHLSGRLTIRIHSWVRVKHLQEQHLFGLLLPEIMPLLSRAIVHIHVGALELSSDVVAFNQILVPYRTWVAEGQRVILHRVLDRPPNAVCLLVVGT